MSAPDANGWMPAGLAALAAMILVYLCGSFIAWDLNPAHWNTVARAVVTVFALWAAGTSAIVVRAS